MKTFAHFRDRASSAIRQRTTLTPVLAAAWLITCAPAFAHGQALVPTPQPAVAERAAPGAADPERVKAPDVTPLASASPTPSHAEESADAAGDDPEEAQSVSSEEQRLPEEQPLTLVPAEGNPAPEVPTDGTVQDKAHRGVGWKAATEQTLLFLSIQHGYAFTQPKTRRDLSGPFFKDYFRSVKSIGKWGDGGKFFTNYVAHPMQGALLGFVWVQNDPQGQAAPFGRTKAYWRSRAKALAWSAVWSTQFEIGPVSQASIGNVGLHGKQTWVDIVITPTLGTAWLVAEDALDRFVVRRIEGKTNNRFVRIVVRMLFNPTRSSANLLRFEHPWRRDR